MGLSGLQVIYLSEETPIFSDCGDLFGFEAKGSRSALAFQTQLTRKPFPPSINVLDSFASG